MGQVSRKLRSTTDGFAWYCPGCQEMHPLPTNKGWTFDGNLEQPTFTPSFRHTWNCGPLDRTAEEREGLNVCHYIVTAGNVNFCSDSTHNLSGQTIVMPNLPVEYQDHLN